MDRKLESVGDKLDDVRQRTARIEAYLTGISRRPKGREGWYYEVAHHAGFKYEDRGGRQAKATLPTKFFGAQAVSSSRTRYRWARSPLPRKRLGV